MRALWPGAVAKTASEVTSVASSASARAMYMPTYADVVSHRPDPIEQVEMGVATEIEVAEIRDHVVGAAGRDSNRAHERAKRPHHLNVHAPR
jgi:hypothetical protein